MLLVSQPALFCTAMTAPQKAGQVHPGADPSVRHHVCRHVRGRAFQL